MSNPGTTASASTSASASSSATSWTSVGEISQYGARTTIKVHGRRVTVLRLRKRGTREIRWLAVDATCYHAGGPLGDGALVTAGGRTCLKCPWHSYLIDVFSGEGLYMHTDRTYRSKGVRQRVHEVETRDDGHLYVRLKLQTPAAVPSDEYAYGFEFARAEEVPAFP